MTSTTVLVVEDERELADIFSGWLRERYEVRTAYEGEAAVAQFDDDIDIVLLDRRMPRFSGDDVLKEIRDRGLEYRVALVTAVEPDFDILEMGFDDYVVKPVAKDELLSLVERLESLRTYDDAVEEYFQLITKKAALEESKNPQELADSDEYDDLREEIDAVRRETDSLASAESPEQLF